MDNELNIQEYIASGILELYVAGALAPEEAQEVTTLVQRHPELQVEVAQIESALMQLSGALVSPDTERDTLAGALEQIAAEEQSANSTASVTKETKLVSLQSGRWRMWVAAASVLLLISVIANLFFYAKWQDTASELTQITAQRDQIAQEGARTQASLNLRERMLAHLNAPESQEVLLGPLPDGPQGQVRVVWNEATAEVLLKIQDLPEPPAGTQYQLWALIPGVDPVDMGVLAFDGQPQFAQQLTGTPMAFAITLEPEGGSKVPTLDQMCVYGEAA